MIYYRVHIPIEQVFDAKEDSERCILIVGVHNIDLAASDFIVIMFGFSSPFDIDTHRPRCW